MHHSQHQTREGGKFGPNKTSVEIYQKGWTDGYVVATLCWTAKFATETAKLTARATAIAVAMSARAVGWTSQQMWDVIRLGSRQRRA